MRHLESDSLELALKCSNESLETGEFKIIYTVLILGNENFKLQLKIKSAPLTHQISVQAPSRKKFG